MLCSSLPALWRRCRTIFCQCDPIENHRQSYIWKAQGWGDTPLRNCEIQLENHFSGSSLKEKNRFVIIWRNHSSEMSMSHLHSLIVFERVRIAIWGEWSHKWFDTEVWRQILAAPFPASLNALTLHWKATPKYKARQNHRSNLKMLCSSLPALWRRCRTIFCQCDPIENHRQSWFEVTHHSETVKSN